MTNNLYHDTNKLKKHKNKTECKRKTKVPKNKKKNKKSTKKKYLNFQPRLLAARVQPSSHAFSL